MLIIINVDDDVQQAHAQTMDHAATTGSFVSTAATPTSQRMLEQFWHALGADPAALSAVRFAGPERVLPSAYEVSACAAASIAASNLAVARWHAWRSGTACPEVHVDTRHAAAAFRLERYLVPQGWQLAQPWDPIAGDYPTRDGWIRLHTNYGYHRDAALRVLGVPCERERVAAAVATLDAEPLEAAVLAAGGCAAAMRTSAQWHAHPAGRALDVEPLVGWHIGSALGGDPMLLRDLRPGQPLGGVRVLDLTRVIAGPMCTRALAAFGADVLRIDPPGFAEVEALLPEATLGKRRAALDLKSDAGRAHFEQLIAQAHVLVHGLRPDALPGLGWDRDRLWQINPELIIVCHDAYGWSGPLRGRRGFDSLVQMSCGIAAHGMQRSGSARPVPLPAQALDYATGYMLAAAACEALLQLATTRRPREACLSLARTAHWLMAHGDDCDLTRPDFSAVDAEPFMEHAVTAFGPVRRVRYPGTIAGVTPAFAHPAGPLATHDACW